MRLQYRVVDGAAEIVRCYGLDPEIEIPEQVDGIPVRRMAPYAFSSRKSGEDEDVLETFSGSRTDADFGELLAGDRVEKVRFPDGMEQIGRYIFYGCRNLKELSFSGRLVNIGSGAFTGCRGLSMLRVRLEEGFRSCVPEILGDLWQRIDVVFENKEETARLVFPEHYEEAVENTPARILFTQHHGSGNNYRQCFYAKEPDFKKYDDLFYSARAQDRTGVITDLVFSRLMYPVDLTEKAKNEYERYLRENGEKTARYLIDRGDPEPVREMTERGLWTQESLNSAVEYAASAGAGEILSLLMDVEHRMSPGKRDKYEL